MPAAILAQISLDRYLNTTPFQVCQLKYRAVGKSLSQIRKETSSEACQGRALFQQHRGARFSSSPPPHSLQGKAPKEIHASLTEALACFLPGRAKDLSAPLVLT